MCVCFVCTNSTGFLCVWHNCRGVKGAKAYVPFTKVECKLLRYRPTKANVILASCRNFLPRKRGVKFIRCPLTTPLIACKITAITNYVRLALVFCSKCLQRSRDAIKANQRILITAFYPAHIFSKGKNNPTKKTIIRFIFFIFFLFFFLSFFFQHSSP